jgi:hypothetical protein
MLKAEFLKLSGQPISRAANVCPVGAVRADAFDA